MTFVHNKMHFLHFTAANANLIVRHIFSPGVYGQLRSFQRTDSLTKLSLTHVLRSVLCAVCRANQLGTSW